MYLCIMGHVQKSVPMLFCNGKNFVIKIYFKQSCLKMFDINRMNQNYV